MFLHYANPGHTLKGLPAPISIKKPQKNPGSPIFSGGWKNISKIKHCNSAICEKFRKIYGKAVWNPGFPCPITQKGIKST